MSPSRFSASSPTGQGGPIAGAAAVSQAGSPALRRHLANRVRAWSGWCWSWLRPSAVVYLGPQGPLQTFERWCQAHPGVAVRLVLSGHLTHQTVHRAPQHTIAKPGFWVNTADARSQRAAHAWAFHYGDAARHWPLATWHVAEWEGSCALHGLDLAALRHSASQHGVRLVCAMPLWAALLSWMDAREPNWCRSLAPSPRSIDVGGTEASAQGASGASAVLAIVEGALLTWVGCDPQGVCAVLQRRLAQPSVAALDEKLTEMGHPQQGICVVGFGLEDGPIASPEQPKPRWKAFTALESSVLPGPVLQALPRKASRRWPQLDWLRAPNAWGVWGWSAGVLAWVSLGIAVAFFVPSCTTLEHGRRALDAAEVGLQSARMAQPSGSGSVVGGAGGGSAPGRTGRSATGADSVAFIGMQAHKVNAGLRHAWGGVLLPVEATAKIGVRWLELEYSSDSERLRLAGLAIDMDRALVAVQTLSMQPGWSQVVLSKTQEGVGHDPALKLRFELTANYRIPPSSVTPAQTER